MIEKERATIMPCEAHRILWTGGWDSTFRILYLVLHGSRQIQPYYLYFEMRRSSVLELEAIELIQKLFRERFPWAARRITRPIVIKIDDLPQNEELHQAYATLRNRYYLGINTYQSLILLHGLVYVHWSFASIKMIVRICLLRIVLNRFK